MTVAYEHETPAGHVRRYEAENVSDVLQLVSALDTEFAISEGDR